MQLLFFFYSVVIFFSIKLKAHTKQESTHIMKIKKFFICSCSLLKQKNKIKNKTEEEKENDEDL